LIVHARAGCPCYDWGMKDVYRKVIDVLSGCKRVLVTTHVRPDGDALGSVAGMVLGLRRAGIESEVLLLSHLPRKYAFIFHENKITYVDVEEGWPAAFTLGGLDTLVVVDTGTWSQLPGVKKKVEGWNKPKLVIDHHLTQEDWADVKLVVSEAAAAGEIVAELLDEWGIELDREIATALYAAVASDTGWFQFANTRPYTLRLAARLMECGVDTDRIYQALYQNESAKRVALATRAQESLELLEGGRLAVMTLTPSDFQRTGAGVPDTENLINIPLQIATVAVSIIIVEPKDGEEIRVSLRSKGGVDVAKFAEQFGGGGHARASGLRMKGQVEEVRGRIVHAMKETMNDER